MAGHPTTRLHLTLLKAWHAWLAGAFLVAYVTAGENAYAIHQFAGYAVLAAIAVRVVAGLLIPAPSPLRLPRPGWRAMRDWIATRKGRHPLFSLFAAALLAVVGLVAVSGALADGTPWFEDPHEAIAEISLWVIVGHVAFVTYMYAGKKWPKQITDRVVPGQNERAS
jgi:cytochrome b